MKKILAALGSWAVLTLCLAATAEAQHAAGHVGGGAHVAAPHVALPPRVALPAAPVISHPGAIRGHVSQGGAFAGVPVAGFGLRHGSRPFRIFPFPVFFGGPFFPYEREYGFYSLWWPNCGSGLDWGLGCNGPAAYPSASENYVLAMPVQPPVYVYGGERADLVRLFLKDGTVYIVTDYWFVNNELHFTLADEDGAGGEEVIPVDDLDLQKTIDVNTRRGFRFVMRNEPWELFLKDHPDVTPPPVTVPPKK